MQPVRKEQSRIGQGERLGKDVDLADSNCTTENTETFMNSTTELSHDKVRRSVFLVPHVC